MVNRRGDGPLRGKIIIEDVPDQPFKPEDVESWLKKYGKIIEIQQFTDTVVVQFESESDALKAIECEDGNRFLGSIIAMKHVEPGDLKTLRRVSKLVERYTPPGSSDDRSRSFQDDRRYPPSRRGSSSRSPERRTSRFSSTKREESFSSRYKSRSPYQSQASNRSNGLAAKNNDPSRSKSTTSQPPYLVAVIASQQDSVPYAEIVEKQVLALVQSLTADMAKSRQPQMTHIVVLLSPDHLNPCLSDLTKDGVPFAIACSTTNWSLGSCTLRILHAPTQQEHRNMPLSDALALLKTEYQSYLNSSGSATNTGQYPGRTHQPATTLGPFAGPLSSSAASQPQPIEPPNDDPSFFAPSRNVASLLRMLADSRILSIGELDEIADFVRERKRRLEGKRGGVGESNTGGTVSLSSPSSTGPAAADSMEDLKSKILNMLYPAGADPSATNIPSKKGNQANAVQQALDVLMNAPKAGAPPIGKKQAKFNKKKAKIAKAMAAADLTTGNFTVPQYESIINEGGPAAPINRRATLAGVLGGGDGDNDAPSQSSLYSSSTTAKANNPYTGPNNKGMASAKQQPSYYQQQSSSKPSATPVAPYNTAMIGTQSAFGASVPQRASAMSGTQSAFGASLSQTQRGTSAAMSGTQSAFGASVPQRATASVSNAAASSAIGVLGQPHQKQTLLKPATPAAVTNTMTSPPAAKRQAVVSQQPASSAVAAAGGLYAQSQQQQGAKKDVQPSYGSWTSTKPTLRLSAQGYQPTGGEWTTSDAYYSSTSSSAGAAAPNNQYSAAAAQPSGYEYPAPAYGGTNQQYYSAGGTYNYPPMTGGFYNPSQQQSYPPNQYY